MVACSDEPVADDLPRIFVADTVCGVNFQVRARPFASDSKRGPALTERQSRIWQPVLSESLDYPEGVRPM